MEELLLSGALVEFEYQEVNYTGVADSKTFVGRMVSFTTIERGVMTDAPLQPLGGRRVFGLEVEYFGT